MALAPMQKLRESQRWHVSATDERSYWAARLSAELASWTSVADRYLRWMETLASPPDSSLFAIGQDAVKLRRRALHQMPSLAALAGNHRHAGGYDPCLERPSGAGAGADRVAGSAGRRIRRRPGQCRRDRGATAGADGECGQTFRRHQHAFSLRRAAQAVRRRLCGGRPARILQPLRSAGQRMPPDQPGGHRQGRRAGRALVRAEPPLRLLLSQARRCCRGAARCSNT